MIFLDMEANYRPKQAAAETDRVVVAGSHDANEIRRITVNHVHALQPMP